MLKKLILLALGVLCLICLYQSHGKTQYITSTMVFEGETDPWTARLLVENKESFTTKDGFSTYDNEGHHLFTIDYKHDIANLKSGEKLEITCHWGCGSSSTSMTMDEVYDTSFAMETWHTGAMIRENSTVTVTVTIDDAVEEFVLICSSVE